MPESDSPAPTVTVLSNDGEKAVISRETAQAIVAARAAEDAATKAKARLESALKAELGSATEVLVGDEVVFTFKEQRKVVLDGARLKDENLDVWTAFSKEQVTRPLLVRAKVVALLFG